MHALSLTIVALFGLHFAFAAEETGEVTVAEHVPPVVKTFREGMSLLKEAEGVAGPETKASQYREALERLQTALEKDVRNQTVRYNLVCAYALLGQTEPALRHLQTCPDNDDAKRTYFNAALQDPDLDSLRATPEFNAIFGEAPLSRPLSPFEKPVFSDK